MTIDELLDQAEWARDYAAHCMIIDAQEVLNDLSVGDFQKGSRLVNLSAMFSHSNVMLASIVEKAADDIAAGKEPEDWKVFYASMKQDAKKDEKNV